jgi:putative CocE/NonD family hydrolase
MQVNIEFDVPTRLRDGVILRANVYRPATSGTWPTLLMRTPYCKDGAGAATPIDPVQVACRGFLVVIQDTRGRFASEGAWNPFAFEREDGYDSVEWAARLPGSNGRVGMYGVSYFGHTQWAAAAEQPPSLAAISPALTWSDPMDGLFARGGAVELGITVPWTLETGLDHLGRLAISAAQRKQRIKALIDDHDHIANEAYWSLPVNDERFRRYDIPDLGGLSVLNDSSVAARCRVTDTYERVTVPSFNIAGWHDVFLQGALDNYVAMTALGREARLVVGPWSHVQYADPIGEQLYGLRGSYTGVPAHPFGDVVDLQLAWLRLHVGPDPDIDLPEAPVRIFVMGRNVWRDESTWPPAETVAQRHFLHDDGSLGMDPPSPSERQTEFIYDPASPVPTVGGQTGMEPTFMPGPMDQRRIEFRPDVCTFTSRPLQQDLEVTGRVYVILHATSSAPSTDWVARLCDVYPDGRSINLCDGIVRAIRIAGQLARYEIDLWSTSNVFLAGHRLRVHVTSSSFPRWDRNLNTGDQRAARYEVALQRIYHDAEHSSYIELPVQGN